MNRRTILSLFSAGIAVCASGCLPACDPPPGGCLHHADCDPDQECREGTCGDSALFSTLPPLSDSHALGAQAFVATKPTDLPTGDAAQGRLGDFVLRNNLVQFVIQQPGREISVAPFGGNIIDAVVLRGGELGEDQFGEVIPVLNLGMTVNFTEVEVIRDGHDGGSAVVRAYGHPSLWDYVNLTGFLSDGFSTLTPFIPDEELPLRVVVQYELVPDEPVLHVAYALLNQSEYGRRLPIGVALDSGGVVRVFRSGAGFGTPPYTAEGILEESKAVPWFGYVGEQSGSALRPWPLVGDRGLDSRNPTVQVAGVTVSLFSRDDVIAAFSESDFFLEPQGTGLFGFDLAPAGPNLAEASAALMKAQKRTVHTFRVNVLEQDGTAVANATVLVRAVNSNNNELLEPIDAGRTDGNGGVTFSTPSVARKVQVFAPGRPAVEPVAVQSDGDQVNVFVARGGSLSYEIEIAERIDVATFGRAPCRLTVVGPDQAPDRALAESIGDLPPGGISELRYSDTCSSSVDGPIPLVPGRYALVVSAGPAFDVFQQLVDVSDAGATVRGRLHRVVDHGSYVASDWHQHSVNSPDSPVPLRSRLLSYLGEGIELFGGSDHDVITDWEQLVVDYGFDARIQAINGIESTPFDFGHFNVFPLSVDNEKVNGGAVDWAGGEGPTLAPPQVWQRYRDKGAQVIQVNHPRGMSSMSFQTYFDRAALVFEFTDAEQHREVGVARGDVGNQPSTNEQMRIPAGEPMWSAEFDSVEIYNGFSPYSGSPSTRTPGDKKADRILKDAANLVAVGHRPIMVGTSDTHKMRDGANGYPRTYVRARRDSSGRVDPWDALGALRGLGDAENRGDVIVSNGPLPIITARVGSGAGVPPGGLIAASRQLRIEIDVTTPTWMQLTAADVLVSPVFKTDPGFEAVPIDGTRTVQLGAAMRETTGNGGERMRYRGVVDLDLADVNPQAGADAFIIVRVWGNEPLWPAVAERIQLEVDEVATTIDEFVRVTDGVTAYAVANPIFVDVNGDGAFRAPYQP